MDRRHAIAITCAAAFLLVGTLTGRSLGQGDAEAANSYSQAATDQRVRTLEGQTNVLEGKLVKAEADRAALAKQLADAGPAVDLGGTVNTVQKEYEQLKAKLASVEAEARTALAKAQTDAKQQAQKLQQEVQRLREENRKLRSDVQTLGKKVDSLNTTIKGLEGFKNPFGR
jgi:chromosome segregation ATPase